MWALTGKSTQKLALTQNNRVTCRHSTIICNLFTCVNHLKLFPIARSIKLTFLQYLHLRPSHTHAILLLCFTYKNICKSYNILDYNFEQFTQNNTSKHLYKNAYRNKSIQSRRNELRTVRLSIVFCLMRIVSSKMNTSIEHNMISIHKITHYTDRNLTKNVDSKTKGEEKEDIFYKKLRLMILYHRICIRIRRNWS